MGHGWKGLWHFRGQKWEGDWLWVQAAMAWLFWCCQAFREKMKVIACQWKELCAEEVQLRSSAEKEERISKVQLAPSYTSTASPYPEGQSWATTPVQASLQPGGVRSRTDRAQGCEKKKPGSLSCTRVIS